MPYLDRPGARIFFDDTGSGTPVITTHGFIENGSYWGRTGLSGGLANAGFRVIDLDLRGHGRSVSNGPDTDYSVAAIVADIDVLANALDLKRFHLLTHATGGMAGARYAIAHHERLLSLISTDTASATIPTDEYAAVEWDDKPIPPMSGAFAPAATLANMLREVGSFHQIIADLRANIGGHALSPFFNRFAANPDPERCWRWTEDIYAVNNPLTCADFALGFFRDPDPQVVGLRQIKCPSLVLIGEHDVFLRKPAEVLARNIPGSDYIVLDGLGHMIAIEDPQRTQQNILSFLKRH